MTTKSRTYPDISYVETDTETIVNTLIQGYEKIAGRTLYPADPARLFILWVADIIVQERVNIDFSAKQNIPRYAEGEYLDSLAELFKGAERLEPEKARTTCNIRFLSRWKWQRPFRQARGPRLTVKSCSLRWRT